MKRPTNRTSLSSQVILTHSIARDPSVASDSFISLVTNTMIAMYSRTQKQFSSPDIVQVGH